MPKGKKHLIIKIPSEADREKYIEYIMDAIQSQFAKYRVKGDRLEIQLTGDPVSIQRSIKNIKRAQEDFLIEENLLGRKRGVVLLHKSMVGKTLGKPISVEALKILLDLRNIDYEEMEDELVIYQEFEELTREVDELYYKINVAKELFKGKAAEIAAVASMVTNISVEEIAAIGQETGIFKKEENKLSLSKEKTQALAILIESVLGYKK